MLQAESLLCFLCENPAIKQAGWINVCAAPSEPIGTRFQLLHHTIGTVGQEGIATRALIATNLPTFPLYRIAVCAQAA